MYHYLNSNCSKEAWNNYVYKSTLYDFYHTWDYHFLTHNDGDPTLFLYEEGESFIAIPLLKRRIEQTDYFDFTSAYGYVGPISNMKFETLNPNLLERFRESFYEFLHKENIVSVFSRLHPLIPQNLLLYKIGGLYDNGRTVAIDLKVPYESQISEYRKDHRSKIKQLRKKGFYGKEASTPEEIKEFVRIYNENMERVKASPYYFFDENYFLSLLNSEDFKAILLLIYYEDKIAAGSIFITSNNIMQFHLSGTNSNFLRDAPAKLLIDEASLIARKEGLHYLHLGGGLGGAEDSLFDFKSGFSNLYLNFKTWRFIVNESIYDSLVKKKYSGIDLNNNVFPLYRTAIQ
jgi:lipid II:glycine glycyltransferase (peptidoglycan interpeptide bridge formation enzyme)